MLPNQNMIFPRSVKGALARMKKQNFARQLVKPLRDDACWEALDSKRNPARGDCTKTELIKTFYHDVGGDHDVERTPPT